MTEYRVDKKIDLKGEVCPYTFVKSKLAMETMKSGEVLEVIVNHKPAVENVPRSLENEGHDSLEVEKIGEDEWRIVVKKA